MTKPCTIDPDKPCQGCMLRGTSLKAKVSGSLDARFLVVTNPPTEKRLVDKENMTKGGMQVFAANMEKCGFDAQDFMFMPYIRCHFDEDQLTTREKSDIRKHCVHWLAQTAEHFNPEVIIPLGVEPSKAVYGRGVKLGKIRGIADHVEGFDQLVMTLTDPGSIFFRPEHEPIFASDCRTLERLVKYDYDKEAAAEQVLGEYETVTDLQFLIDNPPEVLAFDTETTGLRWYEPNKILTMQFTTAPGNGYMVVWDHPEKPFPRRLRKKLKQQLKQVLQNPNTSVVGQNLKFDALFVWKHFGFRFRIDDDTLMLAAIVDENAQTKDLDTLTKLYAPEMAGYADAFNAKWDKSRMDLVPLDELEGYGCGDTDACLRVYYALMSIVDQDEGLYQTYRRVSIPGINAFYGLEPRGLNVNGPALDDLQEVLTESVREQNISLMSRVDKAIKRKHITSAKDPKDRAKAVSWSRKEFMIDVLFKHPKGFLLKPSVFTAKTQHLADPSRRVPSCSSKEHLPYFFEEEPFTEELTAYIKDERLLSTNVVSFRNKYIHRGKVYPSYSLHTAVTGRTASSDPNGQNFPKRGKLAKAYRKIFVPPSGRYMLEADLSQAELRFAAESANEKVMLEIYQNGGDIHTITAAVTMGIDPDVVMRAKKDYTTLLADVADDWPGAGMYLRSMTPEKAATAVLAAFIGFKRTQAKAINFGFIYGMGWRKFIGYAKTQYGIEFTEAEAQETRRVFFQTYPGLAPWHDRVRAFAKKNKYVRSFSGRVRHLPMIDSKDEMIAGEASRQAVNSPIQEFASSLGVMSMGRIDAEVDPEYMALTAFVHDALYAYCWPQHIEWAAKTMKYYMESNPLKDWFGLKLHVPIIADVGFGLNGGETHEMGDLELDKPFDFDSIPNLDIDIPAQVIPPNNGRIIQPEHLRIRY